MNIVFYVLVGAALGIIYVAASKVFYKTGSLATKIIERFKNNINHGGNEDE